MKMSRSRKLLFSSALLHFETYEKDQSLRRQGQVRRRLRLSGQSLECSPRYVLFANRRHGMNLDEISDAAAIFDRIMAESLRTCFDELTLVDCYRREYEVANLFAFGHLVPHFVHWNFDLRQIGIEYPVRQKQRNSWTAPHVRKHLVIWPHVGATFWNDSQPFAIVVWKNTSGATTNVKAVIKGHKLDIEWLTENRELMQVGYACLIRRDAETCSLSCVRVDRNSVLNFLHLPSPGGVHESCARS